MEDFYNILFEVSNEDRHSILIQLEKESANVTQISKTLGISLPEASRHLSRLSEVGLTRKDSEGLYHLTHYGGLLLRQLRELEFTTRNREYFTNHSVEGIPPEFVKRLGDLSESASVRSAIGLIQGVESLIRDAERHVWFQGDEYIMGALQYISEALERDVAFRIIEPEDNALGQGLTPLSPKELSILSRPPSPTLDKKTLESISVFLYVSEKMAAVAFPMVDGRFDYLGFTATDKRSIKWCRDLFLHYWEQANPKTVAPTLEFRKSRTKVISEPSLGRIIIEGVNDPEYDHRAVQEAVDNYDEVVLRGVFNLGSSGIEITRSCALKGEGRENGIPSTKIYKSKWQVPFTTNEWLISTKGEGIDVSIANIHFTDFNGACIKAYGGNSLTIRDNRITLETGYARGRRHPYGDMVMGILVSQLGEHDPSVELYPGRVIIDGNYLDFGLSYLRGGHLPRRVEWQSPSHHPNLHEEYYIGAGIFVNHVEGHVSIQDNTLKNMNTLGINASDCMGSAQIHIKNNLIVSDVFGAHAHGEAESGFGITAHSAGVFRDRPGFKIYISGNTIKCSKISYGGIWVAGPFNAPAGSGKFKEGYVRDNKIHLDDGFVGIKMGRNDGIEVAGNTITGKAYYGIRVHAKGDPSDATMYADGNTIKDNDMDGLTIKPPDDYSNDHVDGVIFTGSQGRSQLAHVWLDPYSRNNAVNLKANETIIDEGEGNTIIFEDTADR